jgi:hypothetical protein
LLVPSLSRPRLRPRVGLAELYAAILIVAITLVLASLVYSQLRYPVRPQPVYSSTSYSILGSPSILHLRINSSSASSISELRIDSASSSQPGILALQGGAGYSAIPTLCAADTTTFFSVNVTLRGELQVAGNGIPWVDGIQTSAAVVVPGLHEVMISNATTCAVTLPGEEHVAFPSPYILSVPEETTSSLSVTLLVPYLSSPHSLTAIMTGGIETFAF